MFFSIAIIAVFWLVFSGILFSEFSDIEPDKRVLTKHLWFRSLMVIAGPVSIVVAIIVFLGVLALDWFLETVLVDLPQSFANFFAKDA